MRKLFLLLICLGITVACSTGSDEPPVVPPDNTGEPPDNNDDDPNLNNQSPSVPSLVFPEKDQLCLSNTLNFQWSAADDPENDALRYNIQISTNRAFTATIEDHTITDTNLELEMQKGQDYYWRVAAIDSEDNRSSYAEANAFYVEGEALENHIPFQPKLISPDNAASVEGSSVMLTWEGSDIDADILSFDLYFGTNEQPGLFEPNISVSQFEVVVQPNQNYYWQIHAHDGFSKSIGTVWSFTTTD